MDIQKINFQNVKLSDIEEFEKNDSLTKNEVILLARNIGITIRLTTKKQAYFVIKKFIEDRDILDMIERTIKGK